MKENYFMKKTFTEFNDMVKALSDWNIEIRQLEPSNIDDTIAQIKMNDIYLGQFQFTGKTHQVGEFPPGRTFVFHWGEESKILWRNKDVPHNALMICPLGAKLDAVTKGALASPHAISVPEELLLSRLQNRDQKLYRELVSKHDLVPVTAAKIKTLKDLFDKYLQGVEDDPELIHSTVYQSCLEEEFISALIDALFSQESDDELSIDTVLVNIWKAIEDYIELQKSGPIKVSELAQTVEVSERTLCRLFDVRFGISPKAYLNKLRLNAVHQDLQYSYSNKDKIHKIANSWGFWHMGQFAADYKKLFGELPSETLTKK